MPSAADIIARLELKPHPEGGHYRETFRDVRTDAHGRSRSTAIYYLLRRGERSHWHRIDAVETWHYYAGDALSLQIANDGCGPHTVTLGPDVAAVGPALPQRTPACEIPSGHRLVDERGSASRQPVVRSEPPALDHAKAYRCEIVVRDDFLVRHHPFVPRRRIALDTEAAPP